VCEPENLRSVVNTSAKASRYFTASVYEALLAASLIGKQKRKFLFIVWLSCEKDKLWRWWRFLWEQTPT